MYLGNLTWTETQAHAHKPVVVPIAAFEQHGHHLPMLTDSMICTQIARRAEVELGDSAVFLPILWIGCSDHHKAFPGTISARQETYIALLEDMAESLIRAGFRRMFFLNAHGGNIVPCQAAIYNVNLRHYQQLPDLFITLSSWFEISRAAVSKIEGITQQSVLHACEWETSAILHAHPKLVKRNKIAAVRTKFNSRFWSPDHSGPTSIHIARTIDQTSPDGAIGRPELATPELGGKIITTATAEVVAFVREFAKWPIPKPKTVRAGSQPKRKKKPTDGA
jgi:creatinine amidohydrolase